MAKLKKKAGSTSTASAKSAKPDSKAQAERFTRTLSESAQQIWLAGMGAFNRAQAEGGKLFESLVRDGLSLEQTARKFTGGRADFVRDAVEGKVGQARERAADTWDKIDYSNMAAIDRTVALAILMVANDPQPPRWNTDNPKTAKYVEAARALRAVQTDAN